MSTSAIEKTIFVVSVAVLAFLSGYVVRWHGWFPDSILEQVSQQASGVYLAWSPGPVTPTSRTYDRAGVSVVSPDKVQPGVTLLQSSWEKNGEWKQGLKLIDRKGHTVHEWRPKLEEIFPNPPGLRGRGIARRMLHGSYLFPNGDVLVNVEYIGTARLDACGQVLWRLQEGGHHSIARAQDGTFWISSTSQSLRTKTESHPNGFPGLDDPVWLDQITHVTGDGEVLRSFNVLDILYANDLQRFIVKANQPEAETDGPRSRDLTHLNDVEPLSSTIADEYPLFEAGDLLVSLRNIHLVLVVDPDSGTVKWHASVPFIQQHDPDYIGGGWIGVFDNNEDFTRRGTMLGGSRIVTLQPHTDSMKVVFPTQHSAPFYTPIQGKWQQLENGNLLLTEAKAGRVVEVTPEGQTVWEWVKKPYSASEVPAVKEGSRYDLTRGDIASWPCSSVDSVSTYTKQESAP